MVRCNSIDGAPCSCDLEDPCIKYLVQSITSHVLKYIIKTITVPDMDELQLFMQMPDAATYLQLYIDQLSQRISGEEPYSTYVTQHIVINVIKFILKTITHSERDELEHFARMPDAGDYLRLYIEEIDKERSDIAHLILATTF